MTSESPALPTANKPEVSSPLDNSDGDIAGSLLEGVGASVVTGVTIIPLVVPGEKGRSRVLFSKLLLQDADNEVVYNSTLPVDILITLACNMIRGCSTCTESLGRISDDDLLFLERSELAKSVNEAALSLQQIKESLS